MNTFEKALREIAEALISLKDKSGLDIALALVPLLLDIKTIADSISGVPRAEYLPQIKQALDNLIGEEPTALIGPNAAALVKINTGFVSLEGLSDLILNSAERKLLESPDGK